MVNPVTVMKMLNERKKFMANHPHFFDFFVNAFGKGVEKIQKLNLVLRDPERKVLLLLKLPLRNPI